MKKTILILLLMAACNKEDVILTDILFRQDTTKCYAQYTLSSDQTHTIKIVFNIYMDNLYKKETISKYEVTKADYSGNQICSFEFYKGNYTIKKIELCSLDIL